MRVSALSFFPGSRLRMALEQNYRQIGWGITRRCNLSCPHCYSSAVKSSEGEFTTDECKQIIDTLAALGVDTIGWTGGEPLLRKDLEELIVYAHGHNIDSGITTNGIPLTPKRAESLSKAGLRSLQVSLDGSTPERNHQIREARLEDFPLIIDNVKLCLEFDLPVHMAMILGSATLDDVLEYVDMCRDLGVESIRFCGFIPHGDAVVETVRRRLDFAGRHGDLADLIDNLLEIESPKLRLDPALGPLPPAYRFHKCIAGVETFYITYNGDIYPCTGLLHDRFKVGNIREKSLTAILNDPKMTEMASFDHDNIHGHCRECPYFRVCRGACRGAVYAHTGDLNASFPVCLYRASTEQS